MRVKNMQIDILENITKAMLWNKKSDKSCL